MKIISIGSDANLLLEGSPVRDRMKVIGQACDELHSIVPGHGAVQKISPTVFVHPTNTTNPFTRVRAAVAVGCSLSSCDLVTAQDPFEYGIAALALGKKLGVPVEIQVHTDIGSPFFGRGCSWQEMRNKIRMIGVSGRLKRAASVRVVSERVARAVERRGVDRKRITVLPVYIQGQNYTSIARTPSNHEKSILMIGRLEVEKGYPAAFEAFARVLNRFPEARLYIAGNGRLHAYLMSCVQKYNIAHAVIFLGVVTDVSPYLASADVFLHAAVYEGFGVAVAEAVLAGVPFVSTDVGIVGTILHNEKHGHVVPVGDVDAIADALIETLSYPQRAHEQALLAGGVLAQYILSADAYVARLKNNWSSIKK
ncbi:glycosyltransferase [Candidatus Campbellbacteria bacterium]|nr:MAG: glycosyltransferase [Candidatus Campbellbacteria bacterium]